ncbi:unnamed protein product, partial [Choristocarpus tenellus]
LAARARGGSGPSAVSSTPSGTSLEACQALRATTTRGHLHPDEHIATIPCPPPKAAAATG